MFIIVSGHLNFTQTHSGDRLGEQTGYNNMGMFL